MFNRTTKLIKKLELRIEELEEKLHYATTHRVYRRFPYNSDEVVDVSHNEILEQLLRKSGIKLRYRSEIPRGVDYHGV